MQKSRQPTESIHIIADRCISLPITYHTGLGDLIWVSESTGWTVRQIRSVSEKAIRSRHQEAKIEHESDNARGNQPNIYCLELSEIRSMRMHFTVEQQAIVIRGYSWDAVGEPLDDFDGGGLFSEYAWHLPPQ